MSRICNVDLSSISIVTSNFLVMWTQPPDALRTTCLVGVSGVWPMVFYSLYELRVLSEALYICNQTVAIQFYWCIFSDLFCIKEKGCHQTVCMCFLLFLFLFLFFILLSVFVLWSLVHYFVFYFVYRWEAESFFMSLLFAGLRFTNC